MATDEVTRLLRTEAHVRTLRFLFASSDGLDPDFLSQIEMEAAAELLEAGVASMTDQRLVLDRQHALIGGLLDALNTLHAAEAAEIIRLRESHHEMSGMLTFLHDLLNVIIGARTVAELFRSAFRRLAGSISFDIGCAVMLEQNLDLYMSKLPRHEDLVNDALIDSIRRTLQTNISASFQSTDVIIRGDFSDLPANELGGNPIEYQIQTLLRLDNRIAGCLILFRAGAPFSPEAQRVLDILTGELAIVLGNIRANEQIQNLADTDDLTGIWNKRAFRRQLPAEVERARTYGVPLSLILFDVDDFKHVNDTFGHVMGDVLLSELCGTVRETLRPPDLFARFGGDEFALILPHTELQGARTVAERMIKKVRELQFAGPDETAPIRCTISVGVASLDGQDKGAAEFLQRADEKLYESKRLGKDRVSW